MLCYTNLRFADVTLVSDDEMHLEAQVDWVPQSVFTTGPDYWGYTAGSQQVGSSAGPVPRPSNTTRCAGTSGNQGRNYIYMIQCIHFHCLPAKKGRGIIARRRLIASELLAYPNHCALDKANVKRCGRSSRCFRDHFHQSGR